MSQAADPLNDSLSASIKAPPECLRVEVGYSFFRDIALGCLQRWWIPVSEGESKPVQYLVFFCADPPLGFKGELAVRVVHTVQRKRTELVNVGLLQSLDRKCTWPDSHNGGGGLRSDDSCVPENLMEYTWTDIGADVQAPSGCSGDSETGELFLHHPDSG